MNYSCDVQVVFIDCTLFSLLCTIEDIKVYEFCLCLWGTYILDPIFSGHILKWYNGVIKNVEELQTISLVELIYVLGYV